MRPASKPSRLAEANRKARERDKAAALLVVGSERIATIQTPATKPTRAKPAPTASKRSFSTSTSEAEGRTVAGRAAEPPAPTASGRAQRSLFGNSKRLQSVPVSSKAIGTAGCDRESGATRRKDDAGGSGDRGRSNEQTQSVNVSSLSLSDADQLESSGIDDDLLLTPAAPITADFHRREVSMGASLPSRSVSSSGAGGNVKAKLCSNLVERLRQQRDEEHTQQRLVEDERKRRERDVQRRRDERARQERQEAIERLNKQRERQREREREREREQEREHEKEKEEKERGQGRARLRVRPSQVHEISRPSPPPVPVPAVAGVDDDEEEEKEEIEEENTTLRVSASHSAYSVASSPGTSGAHAHAVQSPRVTHTQHQDKEEEARTVAHNKLASVMAYLEKIEANDNGGDGGDDDDNVDDVGDTGCGTSRASTSLTYGSTELAHCNLPVAVAMLDTIEQEQKQKTMETMRRALEQQRERVATIAREKDQERKQKMAQQQREHETAVKRHLKFIEQLIEDKKVLAEKCETLVGEVRDGERKWNERLRIAEDNHARELRLQRERVELADKAKRGAWVSERTRQIKEATIKGLEPEIQSLISQHQREMRELKEQCDAEGRAAVAEATAQGDARVAQARERAAEELARACERERDSERRRYERLEAETEEQWEEKKRRVEREMMAERERAEEALQTRVGELEKAVAQAERRGRLARESAREEMENERVEWMEGQRKRMASHMDTREEEMREEMRKERDREIEMVIGRLEEDAAKAEEATAKKWQTRVGQLETELERERARTRAEQDEMARRESQLSESREQTEKVRRELKALQSEQSRERARLVALESERATVERAVRSEVYDRQVELEREIGELRGARVRDRAEFDAELDAVQVRVRQAVAKKEDSVRVVRAQLQQAKARAAQLEALLEAQRVEFLSKNK